MAGIGFELKGLFQKKGIFAFFRAYGYAGIITTGPMILGIVLLMGVMFLARCLGISKHEQDLLVCMITYALLGSLIITSYFSMPTTRYIADMLYEEKEEAVLPSFWGVCKIVLTLGGILYGAFLCVAGVSVFYILLNFILFCQLLVVWMAMNYLTAIKEYRGVLISFVLAIVVSGLTALVFAAVFGASAYGMLLAVSCGYGVMMVSDIFLLVRRFPCGGKGCYTFLKWFDEYRSLAYIGLFTTIGMMAHLVIMWFSAIGEQVQGLFYGAPLHDIPALLAFLSILLTTVNYVVSVEVNFYPKYRVYYSLFNDKGSVKDIMQAEEEMLTVLDKELSYTARKQMYLTALLIAVGTIILEKLPLGFNDTMEGYFRILCVGYGIYAVGNTMMLSMLYFTDYKGAFVATASFAVISVLGTLVSLLFNPVYYGFGFLFGSTAFYLIAWRGLSKFTKNLPYHILSTQPIVAKPRYGVFSKAAGYLERREELHLEK